MTCVLFTSTVARYSVETLIKYCLWHQILGKHARVRSTCMSNRLELAVLRQLLN